MRQKNQYAKRVVSEARELHHEGPWRVCRNGKEKSEVDAMKKVWVEMMGYALGTFHIEVY